MGADKPKSCSLCPLYDKGFGFALDCGNPETARYALMLEAPGRDEIAYRLLDSKPQDPERARYDRAEYERRRKAYPQIPDEYLKKGMALVGKSWWIMAQWAFRRLGIKREDLFIGNVLRCLPPKNGKSGEQYPTGKDRKLAEYYCRQYDTQFLKFNPQVSIVTLHPAALTRSITPLPLLIRSCEKLRDCGSEGIRAALLCGGKSVKLWLGYYDSVTRFQGHYAWFSKGWYKRILERFKKPEKEEGPEESKPRRRGRRAKAAAGLEAILGE